MNRIPVKIESRKILADIITPVSIYLKVRDMGYSQIYSIVPLDHIMSITTGEVIEDTEVLIKMNKKESTSFVCHEAVEKLLFLEE